jgi:hypothetical protein
MSLHYLSPYVRYQAKNSTKQGSDWLPVEEQRMAGDETAVFGVYGNPDSVERAGDALVSSGGFSNSDICVLLPQDLEGDTLTGTFLLSVYCATTERAERAREIIEHTDAQALFSSEVGLIPTTNATAAVNRLN